MRRQKKQEMETEMKIEEAEMLIPKEVEAGLALLEVGIPKIKMPAGWEPKTRLGKEVVMGRITDIDEIYFQGRKIIEPEIIDVLLPNLEYEIILIGGTTGKGGGIRRTISKRTTRMHKSGRRFKISIMIAVGNKNGYVGLGLSSGPPGKHRDVVRKSLNKAKLNIIPVRRGCGSWECACGTNHSIPFEIEGKSGSVRTRLYPAPKGVGLVVPNELKKLMRLAGIKDIWSKTRGQTPTRINLLKAGFNALKNLNKFKINETYTEAVGLKIGVG